MAKQSKEPMRYQVKTFSGEANRHFKNKENAKKYYEEAKKEFPFQLIILKDTIDNVIIEKCFPGNFLLRKRNTSRTTPNKLTGIQDSNTTTLHEYKNGRLIYKEVNGVSKTTLAGYFDKFFKKKGK